MTSCLYQTFSTSSDLTVPSILRWLDTLIYILLVGSWLHLIDEPSMSQAPTPSSHLKSLKQNTCDRSSLIECIRLQYPTAHLEIQ